MPGKSAHIAKTSTNALGVGVLRRSRRVAGKEAESKGLHLVVCPHCKGSKLEYTWIPYTKANNESRCSGCKGKAESSRGNRARSTRPNAHIALLVLFVARFVQ